MAKSLTKKQRAAQTRNSKESKNFINESINDLFEGILKEFGVEYNITSEHLREKRNEIIDDIKALAMMTLVENQYYNSNKK